MFIALVILFVLAAALLIPLIVTGDIVAFFKRYALTLGIGLAAILVIVQINLISQKSILRKDLTEDKKYAVAKGLQNIISRLNDPVQIIYYVSPDMQEFAQVKLDMIDELNEIKYASNGKVDFKVEEVDPKDKKLREELDSNNFVRPINTRKYDEAKSINLISGMKITYKAEASMYIPQIYNPGELEYPLGMFLSELNVRDNPKAKPIVAINLPPSPQGYNVPGRPQKGNGFEWIVDEHSPNGISHKTFDVRPIELNQNSTIPENTSLLILIRPKLIDERQRYEVEKYLAEGGKVMLLASPVRLDIIESSLTDTPFGLEDYLKECGLTFGKSILADNANFNVQTGNERVNESPFFITIKPENIDQSTALTTLMPVLVMPTPTEIMLDNATLKKSNLDATVLAKTTKENWEMSIVGNNLVKSSDAKTGAAGSSKQKAVFAIVKGQFPFPYEGKPVPEWPDAQVDKTKVGSPATASAARKTGTLVVCSSPEAFYEPYLLHPELKKVMELGNIMMLLNLTEGLSFGDDLIQLRAKQYATRTISKLSGKENDTQRLLWKFALIAGIPIFVLLFAVYRFVFRRVNQLSYERKFAGTIGPSSFSA